MSVFKGILDIQDILCTVLQSLVLTLSASFQGFYQEVATPTLMKIEMQYPENAVEGLTKNNFKLFFEGSELIVSGKISNELDLLPVEIKAQSVSVQFTDYEKYYLPDVFYGAIGDFKKSFVCNICSPHLVLQLFSHVRKIFQNINNFPFLNLLQKENHEVQPLINKQQF